MRLNKLKYWIPLLGVITIARESEQNFKKLKRCKSCNRVIPEDLINFSDEILASLWAIWQTISIVGPIAVSAILTF